MVKARTSSRGRYERQERLRNTWAHMMVALSGGRTRVTVLLIAVVFILWQLYVFVWQPLRTDATLPAGLTSVQAQLDTASLTKIRDARVERLQHAPNLFSGAEQYFIISPVTARP